jgi:hypothetical protein
MPTIELFRLLQRRAALEKAIRCRGGIKVTEERELLRLRATLAAHSGPVEALLAAVRRSGGAVEAISIDEFCQQEG